MWSFLSYLLLLLAWYMLFLVRLVMVDGRTSSSILESFRKFVPVPTAISSFVEYRFSRPSLSVRFLRAFAPLKNAM